MIYESRRFIAHIARRKELWKADDFRIALAVAGLSGIWLWRDPSVTGSLRAHFPELLTLASIIFGFVLTSLFFYVQAIGNWKSDERIGRIAEKLVDWHVWTVMCQLTLMAYIVGLWALGGALQRDSLLSIVLHSMLVFLSVYPAFQVVNHVLTIWWVFHNRTELEGVGKPDNLSDSDRCTNPKGAEQ